MSVGEITYVAVAASGIITGLVLLITLKKHTKDGNQVVCFTQLTNQT